MIFSKLKIINKAKAFIGTKEGSKEHKYIIDKYNSQYPLPRGYKVTYTDAWCSTFISFLFLDCGYTDGFPFECGCGAMISGFQKLGQWIEDDSIVPRIGDIVFYSWKDNGIGDNTIYPDHVGIVAGVDGTTIAVIEGNYQDSVKIRYISVNGRYIRGFGRPNYSDNDEVSYIHNGIDYSPVFNYKYYITRYEDLRQMTKEQAFNHFLNFGMKSGECRQASEEFNVYTYMKNYPSLYEVFKMKSELYYIHYCCHGKDEGRKGK